MTQNMQKVFKFRVLLSPENWFTDLRCVLSSYFKYFFKITTNYYFSIISQTTKHILHENKKSITHFRYHEQPDYTRLNVTTVLMGERQIILQFGHVAIANKFVMF